ncbi:MAG: hydrogenase maturation protease [Candidatus Thermoplasmatota archaeon]|nr:hydrogenase maturation protease [Candidatus Thermoplasmatota archaeon]
MDAETETELKDFLEKTSRLVIIGLGNEYMGDDAAGVFAIKALNNVGTKAHLINAGTNLMGAMHHLGANRIEKALFIDAAGMSLNPGEVRTLKEEEVTGRCISTHENNFPLAMHYLRNLNPGIQVLFLGIQFQSLEMKEKPEISPKVREGLEQIIVSISTSLR